MPKTAKREEQLEKLLDSREKIGKIDKDHALHSIEALADQISQAWREAKQVKTNFKAFNKVVVAGMGGSALGPDVIKHLLKDKIKMPLEVVNSYDLPAYTDEKTLVLLSSYSGNTEEVISCSKEAVAKKAQIMAISAGGKLAQLAEKNHWPIYLINPVHNPAGQPRLAVGYSIAGIIALLDNAGVIKVKEEELEEAIETIIKISEKCKVEVEASKNPAKSLAFASYDKRPILVASEFLSGAVHVAANQFNENSKTFADYKVLPEINHHLLEGLQFPKSNSYTHLFMLFQSELYHPRNAKRLKLTKEVIEQNNLETIQIDLESENKITQVFELITLMSFTSFYLCMLYETDPCPIPYVDWFKDQMAN